MKKLFFLTFLLILTGSLFSQPTQTTLFDGRVTNSTTTYSNNIFNLRNSDGTWTIDTLKCFIAINDPGGATDSARASIYVRVGVMGIWGALVRVDSALVVATVAIFTTDSLKPASGATTYLNKALRDTLISKSLYAGKALLGDAAGQLILKNRTDWKYQIAITGAAWGNTIATSGSKWTVIGYDW